MSTDHITTYATFVHERADVSVSAKAALSGAYALIFTTASDDEEVGSAVTLIAATFDISNPYRRSELVQRALELGQTVEVAYGQDHYESHLDAAVDEMVFRTLEMIP